jgi:hypothetical protein
VAEDDQLDQLRVVPGQRIHLVAEAAGLVVRAPDSEAGRRLRGGELSDRLAALDALELEIDTLVPQRGGGRLAEHEVELDAGLRRPALRDVEALPRQLTGLLAGDRGGIDVQRLAPVRGPGRRTADDAERDKERADRGQQDTATKSVGARADCDHHEDPWGRGQLVGRQAARRTAPHRVRGPVTTGDFRSGPNVLLGMAAGNPPPTDADHTWGSPSIGKPMQGPGRPKLAVLSR